MRGGRGGKEVTEGHEAEGGAGGGDGVVQAGREEGHRQDRRLVGLVGCLRADVSDAASADRRPHPQRVPDAEAPVRRP